MLEVLLLILAGILLGTFTGMVPGIHVNTVVIVLLSLLPVLLEHFSPLGVVSLIVAMSVVHTFVDYKRICWYIVSIKKLWGLREV